MPRENIERAIRRGTGEEPGVSYEEITYEGYGPGGVAILIQVLTDNKNRSVGEIRHLLGKYNGNLAAENSVAWMFTRKGQVYVEKEKADEEKLLAAALEAGADDVSDDGGAWEVISAPETFEAVRDAVKALGVEPLSAEVAMVPQNYVKLQGTDARTMLKLMEMLDDHDDVQHVWANFDIEEQEIEASLA
jgi:YebC/PmpR family DNA-binding regulatory protein